MATAHTTNFLILFEGRSGSTFLVEALASHPLIHAQKEEFARIRKKVQRGKLAPASQLEWARDFYGGHFKADAVGFKTKPKDIIDEGGFRSFLNTINCKIILLQRRNRVKLVVSLLNAIRLQRSTGDWNIYSDEDRQPAFSVEIETFKEYLEQTEQRNVALNEYAQSLNLPLLELHYEDLLLHTDESLARVCKFLGVAPLELEGSCKKHTSDNLNEVLTNFQELRGCFEGTPYARMFDEVLIDSQPPPISQLPPGSG